MEKLPRTRCQACGYTEAVIIEDVKYGGLRGLCYRCDGNWPES